jgi:myo-inositol-1(or 4)-monophosphatase
VTIANPDTHDLLDLARKAARQAGRLVSRAPIHALNMATKSSPTDLVSEMDHASEKLILELILSARPYDGLIGEEGTSKPSQSGISWLVDPIDGTVNYLRGLPNYSISVAAVNEKEAIVGVVYDPTMDETFAAIRGHGASLNGDPIACSTASLAEAIIGTGFGYSSAQRARQAEVLRSLLPSVGDIRRPGSAAISLCWVACGRLDAFFETGLKPWDWAAGALIALEAGADVLGGEMDRSHRELIVASSPSIAAGLCQMLEVLDEFEAARVDVRAR